METRQLPDRLTGCEMHGGKCCSQEGRVIRGIENRNLPEGVVSDRFGLWDNPEFRQQVFYYFMKNKHRA